MEEQRVFQWLEHPASKQQLEKLMEKQWENPSLPIGDTTDYSRLLEKIHQRVLSPATPQKNRFRSIALRSLKVAATLFLILFTGYFLSLSWINKDDRKELAVTNPVNRIERTTGIGEKLTLTMPDGSRIIVNSESTIQFNSDYGRIDRTVTLSGEAYFEVAPDSLKPFTVEANGFTTLALGTAFNISTKQSSYQVALTEGKVAVGAGKETVNLEPGQMAVWKPDQQVNAIKIQRFDQAKITGWKDGRLAFDRKKLSHILKDLETWYGVTIKIDPGVNSNQLISGTFENKNLKDILTGLSFSAAFSFELNGKQVTIKK
jgi:ferric-dicitrate binding protein FerR (iron transport regulator)